MSAKNSLKNFKLAVGSHKNGAEKLSQEKIEQYKQDFLNAINDDLNMPVALAVCQKLLKEPKSQDVYNLIVKFNEVLGLDLEEKKQDIPDEIKALAEKRWQAKLDKNYAEADRLRGELSNLGYTINDRKDGYDIVKN